RVRRERLVPGGRPGGEGRRDRLLLAGVRPRRGPADLLRRPRHARRRPSEVGLGPWAPTRRRRAALRPGVLPPGAVARWPPAGVLSAGRLVHAPGPPGARRRRGAAGDRGRDGRRAGPRGRLARPGG